MRCFIENSLIALVVIFTAAFAVPDADATEKLQPKTVAAWDKYEKLTRDRIDRELKGSGGFLQFDLLKAADAKTVWSDLDKGNVYVKKMPPTLDGSKAIDVENGLIHHWYGAIFIPRVNLETVLNWVQAYDVDHHFKEVEKTRLVDHQGDTFKINLGLTRTKYITMHYDTYHTVIYQHHGSGQASSSSVATEIVELTDFGTSKQKALPVGENSGFLWRLNSYWRFKEEKGGVVVECESISLSRDMPTAVGILNFFTFGKIKGIIESLPRESLEGMLTTMRAGIGSIGKTK